MSRKSKLTHDAFMNINTRRRYGERKRDDVVRAQQEFTKTGVWQPVSGMFSYETEAAYKKQTGHFIKWLCNTHPDVRNLGQAKQYVAEYLRHDIARGISAYTIHTRAYALAAAFKCKVSEFGVELPIRKSSEFKRTRHPKPIESFRKETQYIHRFAQATGARRGGLEELTVDCLSYDSQGRLLIYLDEKGGKPRHARVLHGEEEFVRAVVEEAAQHNEQRGDGCRSVFPKSIIPNREALHHHRNEYAHRLYDEVIRNGEHLVADRGLYRCRGKRYGEVYNRTALAIVSFNLGHGQPTELPHEIKRVSVVVTNYLW